MSIARQVEKLEADLASKGKERDACYEVMCAARAEAKSSFEEMCKLQADLTTTKEALSLVGKELRQSKKTCQEDMGGLRLALTEERNRVEAGRKIRKDQLAEIQRLKDLLAARNKENTALKAQLQSIQDYVSSTRRW